MTPKKNNSQTVYRRLSSPLELRRLLLKCALDCAQLSEKEVQYLTLTKAFQKTLQELKKASGVLTSLSSSLSEKGLDPLPLSFASEKPSLRSSPVIRSPSRPSSELDRLKEELSSIEEKLSSF